jgi:hypothetical protein
MSVEELEKIRIITCTLEFHKFDTQSIELREYLLKEIPKKDIKVIRLLNSLISPNLIENIAGVKRITPYLERAYQNRVDYYIEPNYNLYARRDEKVVTDTTNDVCRLIETILKKYSNHPYADIILTMVSRRINQNALQKINALINFPEFMSSIYAIQILQTINTKICKHEAYAYNLPIDLIKYLDSIIGPYAKEAEQKQAQKAENNSRQKLIKDINTSLK